MSNGGAAAAAIAAAIAKAIKASGIIVRLSPEEFQSILGRVQNPLVVYAEAGLFTRHRYVVSYKGLAFYTKSSEPILLPPGAETVIAKSFWMPG